MKFSAVLVTGVSDNANVVVEPLPLNWSKTGDEFAVVATSNCLPKYTIKILAPFDGASAKLIFGLPDESEIENAYSGS